MSYKKIFFIYLILFFSACTNNKYLAPVINKNISSENIKSISRTITIYSGDSLYSISKREGVSIRSIIEVNNLEPPFILYEGDQLIIPISKIHIVEFGNTLWDIANCYKVSVIEIRTLNNLRIKDKIYKGKKLFIPINDKNINLKCKDTSKVIVKIDERKKKISNIEKNNIVNNKSDYLWPVKGEILSRYGLLAKGMRNDGINISANKGDPVFAANAGKVVYAGNEIQAFGNLILIKHFDNKTTAYAHLDKIKVKKGQTVKKGEVIAALGSSGKVSKPQLHFELRDSSGPLNPLKFLP